jgi:hypothetical protein
VPRLIGRLHGEHLHHLPEMRVHLRDEAAWNDQRGHFVFDQIRHDLHDGVLDVVGEIERVRDRGPISLRGNGLLMIRAASSDHLDRHEMEIERRRASLIVRHAPLAPKCAAESPSVVPRLEGAGGAPAPD